MSFPELDSIRWTTKEAEIAGAGDPAPPPTIKMLSQIETSPKILYRLGSLELLEDCGPGLSPHRVKVLPSYLKSFEIAALALACIQFLTDSGSLPSTPHIVDALELAANQMPF